MHKKLIIISQRASAVEITARNNVTYFYKCQCVQLPFLPKFFRVYITDEVDESNGYPLWVRHNSQGEVVWKAEVYHSGFARKEVYKAYDSWYMRKNMQKSQEIHLKAHELNFSDRLGLVLSYFKKKEKKPTKLKVVSESIENKLSTRTP